MVSRWPISPSKKKLIFTLTRWVPCVVVAHVQLLETAGKRLWCYITWRLWTELDCSLTGAICACYTCSSEGNRWETMLMLTSREAWKQLDSSLFCRCLPVPAADARLIVGWDMRLSAVCWSMDGAWPAPGSGAHPDLLTASMKLNFEPLWKRSKGNNQLNH